MVHFSWKLNWKEIKSVKTDNDLEYYNTVFDDFCENVEILWHKTITYISPKNWIFERMNKTLLDLAG